jgi:hypothetical protein
MSFCTENDHSPQYFLSCLFPAIRYHLNSYCNMLLPYLTTFTVQSSLQMPIMTIRELSKRKNLFSFQRPHIWLYSEPTWSNTHTVVLIIDFNPLTFWHRSFTFNSNKSPTWNNNFSVYYPDVCLQLNMFRSFFRPSSGSQWLSWQPLFLPSFRGDSRAVFVVGSVGRPAGRPTRTRTQHDYHHDTKVKPEADTTVIELLMMGGKTPETCWAVNKRQDNKLKNCCIRMVI